MSGAVWAGRRSAGSSVDFTGLREGNRRRRFIVNIRKANSCGLGFTP